MLPPIMPAGGASCHPRPIALPENKHAEPITFRAWPWRDWIGAACIATNTSELATRKHTRSHLRQGTFARRPYNHKSRAAAAARGDGDSQDQPRLPRAARRQVGERHAQAQARERGDGDRHLHPNTAAREEREQADDAGEVALVPARERRLLEREAAVAREEADGAQRLEHGRERRAARVGLVQELQEAQEAGRRQARGRQDAGQEDGCIHACHL